jgi:hypothetical integral membrane protein (TIGR02206 family)
MPPTPEHAFHPFSGMHLLVLAGYLPVMIALAWLGRAWRDTPKGDTLHRLWTAFVVLVQLVNILYWATPPNLSPASSLPLHVCDIAGIVAALVMLTRHRLWRVILFYWGIGLSTQAFITPVITEGPETFRFHLFFASHLTIVATAIYDICARGFLPSWRDFRTIILVLLAYGALLIPLNMVTGWNYGYIGNTKPLQPTLIDKLGTWPLRLVWLFFIVTALFALMTAGVRLFLRREVSPALSSPSS